MPDDNATPITPGGAVDFPENGFISDTGITRIDTDAFALISAGVYLVEFTVPLSAAGDLVLTLNGTELAYTVTGTDAAGTLSGSAVINATADDSVITLRNPATATGDVTVATAAVCATPLSAHLIIIRLS
jgi:hypothetical protein